MVNNIVIWSTLYGDRWLPDLTHGGDHFTMYANIKSLCSTHGTNLISQLYFKEEFVTYAVHCYYLPQSFKKFPLEEYVN